MSEVDGVVDHSNTGQLPEHPPSRPDFLARCVILLVLAVWAGGAIADFLMASYAQPWWIHLIALCTVSYALTGQFIDPKLPGVFRSKDPSG